MANNKLKTKKEKFIFFMTVIFFITYVLTKVRSTNMTLKEMKNKQIAEKQQQITEIQNMSKLQKSKYILELSDTLSEAIGYIKKNHRSKDEEVKTIVRDSVNALESIQDALDSMGSSLNNQDIKLKTTLLKKLFDELQNALEHNENSKIENILDKKLLSEYAKWKYDVENEFRK